ncbi:ROK family transcriptional regulator [Curtobacterium sp. ISL-83]|uniref:ROK family transcriptional regulator n=1 Tax=Curtobacterium sp. ISL-83 TaxID=2819145 RepID=UPI001BE95956|nr:ROK family transcriptional regulator [Curtobacterium sp. ISL-83]MBT2503751.1 ROK family transcriptional regulator [Curtobacterium sp. ISL-83]
MANDSGNGRGVQVADLKRMNARAVLAALRATGPATAPELAALLGITKPTVSASLKRLAAASLVSSLGVRAGGIGRSPEVWETNEHAGVVLALDVGSRVVQAAIGSLSGAVLARSRQPLRDTSPEAVLAAISAATDAVLLESEAWAAATPEPAFTVIGVPGAVNPSDLGIRLATNLPGLSDPMVTAALRDRFGERFDLQKDVYLAARGELRVRPPEARDFVLLTLGRGVGAAIVRDGEPVLGTTGFAGEVGYLPLGPHTTASPDEPALERAASRDGLLAAAARAGLRLDDVGELFSAAASGDQRAVTVLAAEADLVAYALATLVVATNPAGVVLAGSIALHGGDPFCRAVRARLDQRLPFDAPPVEIARTGPEATLLGALAVAAERGWEVLADEIDQPDAGSQSLAPQRAAG